MHYLKRFPYLVALLLGVATNGAAQLKPDSFPRSTCSRDSALSLIQRQIDLSKTIDRDPQRIPLLIRVADLSWPLDQDKARATFSDAFEIATRLFKEKGAPDSKDGGLIVAGIDYRYTVITAIAKRDSAWARKLSQQILKEDDDAAAAKADVEAEKEKGRRDPGAAQTSADLMKIALGVLDTNQDTSVTFARSTLQYPATFYTSSFLFRLSET